MEWISPCCLSLFHCCTWYRNDGEWESLGICFGTVQITIILLFWNHMHNYLTVFEILLKHECSLKVIKNLNVQLQSNSRNGLPVKYFIFWILKCKHFPSFFCICAALWLKKKASRYVLNNSPLIKNKNLLWIWKRVHHTLNTQLYQSVVLPGKCLEPNILLRKVVIITGVGPMVKHVFPSERFVLSVYL